MTVIVRRLKSSPPPGFKRVSDWRGKRVRTLRVLENGWCTIPAGTFAVVDAVGGGVGLSLRCDPCAHCGVQAHIRKVSTSYVEMLP